MAIGSQRKKIEDRVDIKGRKNISFGDLFIPLMSIMILLLLVVFVFMPMINEVLDLRSDIAESQSKQSQLEVKRNNVSTLAANNTQLQTDLKISRDIMPTNLDVGDFAYHVDQLANANHLEFEEIESGNTGGNSESFGGHVRGVSGPIVYKGTYDDIVDFLDKLQEQSPFIIEARSIELENRGSKYAEDDLIRAEVDFVDEDIWQVTLDLTGYYVIPESDDVSLGIYTPFSPYTNYPDVMNVFRAKAERLDLAADE